MPRPARPAAGAGDAPGSRSLLITRAGALVASGRLPRFGLRAGRGGPDYARRPRRCPPGCPGGITLIELLLVLALLVVIGSMVVPEFTGSFATVRLQRAGDQVLTIWSKARAEAIETGEAQQFRFTPETGDYVIEPWTAQQEGDQSTSTEQDATSSSRSTRDSPASSSADRRTAASAEDAEESAEEESADADEPSATALPEPVVFYEGESAGDDPLSGERRVDSLVASDEEQSTPIVFFPDGSCTEASVVLMNDREQYLRLTLRGLTGVGRASQVLGREELERSSRR